MSSIIVMACDLVGLKIVEFLVERKAQIPVLVLNSRDPGGFNDKIKQAYLASGGSNRIVDSERLKEDHFLDSLREEVKPEIGFLVWWQDILKGEILQVPRLGWINFHNGFLPFNRGKHANFWSLVDDTPCGVSLHYVDEGVDTGDIVAQRLMAVSWEDTAETIYKKLRLLIVDLFKEKYDSIMKNSLHRIKQDRNTGSSHKTDQIHAASQIDLDKAYTARRLFNLIRAKMFPPYSTAFFCEAGKKYSVEVTIKEFEDDRLNSTASYENQKAGLQ